MNSNLFDQLGLNIDIAYVFIGLIILLIILFILIVIQNNKIKRIVEQTSKFMKGRDAASLEDEIVALFEDNRIIKKATEENQKDINDLYNRLASCFQKIGIIKYDAFNQMGGQLSYSIALLDEDNNGFLLNSIKIFFNSLFPISFNILVLSLINKYILQFSTSSINENAIFSLVDFGVIIK